MRPTGAVPQWLARPLAVGGFVFFVDALLYFAYRYALVFGNELPGRASGRAIAIDVALFTVFAVHHSLFARDTLRKWITRTVGVLERSFYVWVASALFIAVCALWQPVAGVTWRIDGALASVLLTAAQLVGVWLTLRSATLIDIRELAGIKQIGAGGASEANGGDFKTNGPYGWVRHPIYTGWFLMVFAVPTMTMTRLVFALTSSIYLLIAIPFEERSLRRTSRGAYDQYMREVRWKLVPRLF